MAAAEREAAAGAAPRGRLRVNSYVPFGQHRLIPLLPRFLERYPEISVDLVLTDNVIDLVEERADVAIRAGPLNESRLVARKLGQSRTVVVAAPSYLEVHGVPQTPADLDRHNRLGFGFVRHIDGWPFLDAAGNAMMVPITGNALVSDGEAMRLMALSGAGIARLARWHVSARHRHRAAGAASGRVQPRRRGVYPRRVCRPGQAFAGAGAGLSRFPCRDRKVDLTGKYDREPSYFFDVNGAGRRPAA